MQTNLDWRDMNTMKMHGNFDEAIVKYKISAQKYHEAGQTDWEVKTCVILL